MTKQQKALLSIGAIAFVLLIAVILVLGQKLRRKPAPPAPSNTPPPAKPNLPVSEVIKLGWAIVAVIRQIIELKKQMT